MTGVIFDDPTATRSRKALEVNIVHLAASHAVDKQIQRSARPISPGQGRQAPAKGRNPTGLLHASGWVHSHTPDGVEPGRKSTFGERPLRPRADRDWRGRRQPRFSRQGDEWRGDARLYVRGSTASSGNARTRRSPARPTGSSAGHRARARCAARASRSPGRSPAREG